MSRLSMGVDYYYYSEIPVLASPSPTFLDFDVTDNQINGNNIAIDGR